MRENLADRLCDTLHLVYEKHLKGGGYKVQHTWELRSLAYDAVAGVPWQRKVKSPFTANASVSMLRDTITKVESYLDDPSQIDAQFEASEVFSKDDRKKIK